jgi:hypothetical protein
MLNIPNPNYPNDFKFIDPDCNMVATYLYDGVRDTFDHLQIEIIKSIRSFNDVQIPLVDYPVLKVYAESDSLYMPNSELVSTNMKVAYGLAFTMKQKVADVSRIVSKELMRLLVNASLDEFHFQLNNDNTLTANYETLISPEQHIYRYSVIDVNVFTRLSGCVCCD